MDKISRNAPCPCGSGLKYKKCCGTKQPDGPTGLRPGIRMKGGVAYDPESGGFVAIVHTWDNVYCQGEPEEWRAPEIFATEEEALRYYKTAIRPHLERMMQQMASKHSDSEYFHKRLE